MNFLKKVAAGYDSHKHQIPLINTETSVSMLFLNYTFHMQSPLCWHQFGPSAQKGQLQRKEDQRQVGGSICTYTEIISLEEFTLLRALPREGSQRPR